MNVQYAGGDIFATEAMMRTFNDPQLAFLVDIACIDEEMKCISSKARIG